MPDRPLQSRLQDLVADGRTWAELGIVTAVQADDAVGYLLVVELPDGRAVEARLVALSCGGSGAGVWVPVSVGAEVVILYPRGDRHAAVALPGPTSSPAKPPTGWANDKVEVVHEGGIEVRTAEGADVQRVVLEEILADLQTALTEVQVGLAGLGIPTTQLSALILKLPTEYRSAALQTE